MPYAELHCLSNFSFLRGASHPSELIEQAHTLGYTALAITDECSMAGMVRAYEAATALNFKLIVGTEFVTQDNFHVVLLAPTQTAYSQICALITLSRRRSRKGSYHLLQKDFSAQLDDCLALWIPPRITRSLETQHQAAWVNQHFLDRCWIAVELHRDANDSKHLIELQELAERFSLPLTAAGNVHMHVRSRRALQDILTATRHGCSIAQAGHRLFPNGERHLRSVDELLTLYPRELLNETLCIAERCTFSLGSLRYRYPNELIPTGLSATEHLRRLVDQGIQRRWPQGASDAVLRTISDELTLITELQYEHFFLTVYDIVCFAKEQDILHQGRGSAANSVVCYALGITAADPAKIGLLFGRFLSKERNEPPDIDVDFEHERREEVIQYIYKKYGRERAALAATVITYRTRSALRDVGKALGLDTDTVDRIAKLRTYWDDEKTFFQHLTKQSQQIDIALLRRLCGLVKQLKGFPRHLSQHVGGFIIANEPISQLVPIENAAMPDRTIIQWDKNDLEALGLLKVDVLALGMLSALHRTFDLLKDTPHAPHCVAEIPDDDKSTYDMICNADTVGVFQIESRAQMSMLPRLQPRTYYDLVIEVAIVRPGPIQGGMVHPYLKNRRNPNDVRYESSALEPVLKRTLGIPIFQEQVMQIAIVAAGFTPGEADHLRRSMAAWQRSGNLQRFRQKLIAGMLARDYPLEFAERIFKQIEGFAEYGFPESHSASFALLTYYSSYLKRHYPAAFFAALINSQPMGFYAPRQLLETAKRQKVVVLPIDVVHSTWPCILERHEDKDAIRLGMCLLKGLRQEDALRIVKARNEQPFHSIDDLAHRAALNQRTIRLLAMGGALRSLSIHRHAAMWNALGVEKLPGMLMGLSTFEATPLLPVPTERKEIAADYQHAGVSTERHPLAILRTRLQRQGVLSRDDLNTIKDGERVTVCGLITHLQHPQTANGVVFGSLEDECGIHNLIMWPTVFDANRDVALQASVAVAIGKLQNQERVINIIAERLIDVSHWLPELARHSRDFR
jgi:error-prone DNA polymerase